MLYRKEDVGAADVSGSFTIDTTSNLNPVIALQSPKDISVTVQITSPDGDSLPLDINENSWNWNAPGASTGVFALDLLSPAVSIIGNKLSETY